MLHLTDSIQRPPVPNCMLYIKCIFIYIDLLSVHCYIVRILVPQIIAFDELKTDYKNPRDQCNTLTPVSDATAPDTPSLPL